MAAVKVTDEPESRFDTDLTSEDVRAMLEFDFVRFTVADLHGIGRCRVVPRRHFQYFARRGVDLFSGEIEQLTARNWQRGLEQRFSNRGPRAIHDPRGKKWPRLAVYE